MKGYGACSPAADTCVRAQDERRNQRGAAHEAYTPCRHRNIGHECRAHLFQVCAPEHAGARPAPDVTGRPAITLRAMQPPALPDVLSDSASGFPGVPESNINILIHIAQDTVVLGGMGSV